MALYNFRWEIKLNPAVPWTWALRFHCGIRELQEQEIITVADRLHRHEIGSSFH
jgi:hypothetical protein